MTPGDVAATTCFRIKQSLARTPVTESSRSVPNLGVDGRQTDAYWPLAHHRSPLATLHAQHADVTLLIPAS